MITIPAFSIFMTIPANTLIDKSIRGDGMSEYSVLPLGRFDKKFDQVPGLCCRHVEANNQHWSRLAAILVKDNRRGEVVLVSIGDLLPFEFFPGAEHASGTQSNIQQRLFRDVNAYFQKRPVEHETLFAEFYGELQSAQNNFLGEILEATQRLAEDTQRPTQATRVQRSQAMKITLHTMILRPGDELIMAKSDQVASSSGHRFRCERELFRQQSFNKRRHSFNATTSEALPIDTDKLTELMPNFVTLDACAPSQLVVTQCGHGHELAALMQFWNGSSIGRSPLYNQNTRIAVSGHRLYRIIAHKLNENQLITSALLNDYRGERLTDPVIMPDSHTYSRETITLDRNSFRLPETHLRITRDFWCCPRTGAVYLDTTVTDDIFTRQLLEIAFPEIPHREIASLNT